MTQVGEGVSVGVTKDEKPEKGTMIVHVVDACTDKAVEGARVRIQKRTADTDSSGKAEFKDLTAGSHGAFVTKHFADCDYIKFIVHYVFPFGAVTWSGKAESEASGADEVPPGGTVEIIVPIEVYRLVQKVVFRRLPVVVVPRDYGHWWVEIDDSESYGWWPKYALGAEANRTSTPPVAPTPPAPGAGRASQVQFMAEQAVFTVRNAMFNVTESSLWQTMRGVYGELNGQTSFPGGSSTEDPHHGDSGGSSYQPVINDCTSDADIKDAIRTFARSYTGNWSWRFEFGNHCHTFQKGMISKANLDKFKEL